MTKGATPTTPGTVCTFSMTLRYSRKSLEYLRTRTCALTPSTFSRNSARKPPVTLMTVDSAAAPSATPKIANMVPTDTNARFFERM